MPPIKAKAGLAVVIAALAVAGAAQEPVLLRDPKTKDLFASAHRDLRRPRRHRPAREPEADEGRLQPLVARLR